MAKHSPEKREEAKLLYLRGFTISEIKEKLKVAERTLYQWRDAEDWEKFCTPVSPEMALSRRINLLSERANKTKEESDELDRLFKIYINVGIGLATANKINAEAEAIRKHGFIPTATGKQPNEPRERKAGNKKEKAVKNDISSIDVNTVDDIRKRLFPWAYHELWYANKYHRTRFILKSRQIGGTMYIAWERLECAIRTGENQVFLSASRNQVEVFKAYIIAFAKEEFDIELKGTEFILLSNGAQLRFLSTNATTANSYTGHLIVDEVFTIPNFEKVNKMASPIASQKRWTTTYLSIPTSKSHPAYKIWNGDKYNSNKPIAQRQKCDISHEALKNGAVFGGIWRHILTIEDAQAQGCNLFDIDELRDKYSPDEFDNLFMCKFIDDSKSAFDLNQLLLCQSEINCFTTVKNDKLIWVDYKPDAQRPFGNKPVTIGYDPSRSGDGASLAVLNAPANREEIFRLLKRVTYYGNNFSFQANRIKDEIDSHNVVFCGIDRTGGIGIAVFDLVEVFYPLVTGIHYSPEMKSRLVLKAQNLITEKRFSFLPEDAPLVINSFLKITKTITAISGATTYVSQRTEEHGEKDHADLAWAIMHGFLYEPIRPRAHARATFTN